MFKLVLEKAEEPEIKLSTSAGSWIKQESSRKTSISALLTMPKPLTVWITINWGQFWKRREYQTTWPASWETYMQVRKQQLGHGTTDWFQIGKGVRQGCILSPCLFNLYVAGRSTSWNQDCREKYQSLQICRWHHPYGRKRGGTKKPLDESERGEGKSWLKVQHSEYEDHGIRSHHFMANRWGNSGWLYFWGVQNHCRWWLQPWN